MKQPGDILKSVFSHLGFHQTENCQCAKIQELMNVKGWRWCWLNRQTIVVMVTQEAHTRGIVSENANLYELITRGLTEVLRGSASEKSA